MSRPALSFQRIAVHRAAGVERGGAFSLDGLHKGVNLIHGPNGSGKTTTARVIQELLWPGRTRLQRPTVEGEFLLDNSRWRVEIDAGSPFWHRDGIASDPPELGPAENRFRYYLALDELVREEDTDFAKRIVDASRGGYDLQAAAQALGYRASPSTRIKLRKEVEKERHRLREAYQKQQELEHRARELDRLKESKEEAAKAARDLEHLRRLQQLRSRQAQCRELQSQLDALPRGISLLRGDEGERIDTLKQEREAKEQELTRQQNLLQEARQEEEQCGLPQSGPHRRDLDLMDNLCQGMEKLESEIRQLRRERDKAAENEERTRQRLGSHISEAKLHGLDHVEIGDLTTLARELEQASAQGKVLQERRKWLSQPRPSDLDPDTVKQGLRHLTLWLAQQRSLPAGERQRLILAAVAVLPSLLALALVGVHHWAWLAAVPLGPVLAWLAAKGYQSVRQEAEKHREEYRALGLPEPDSWSLEGVMSALERLQQIASSLKLHEERSARLQSLQSEEEEHQGKLSELDRRRAELEDRLGLALQMGGEWLSLLADNLGRWQQALDELRGLGRKLDGAREEHRQTLYRLAEMLKPYGYDAPETAEEARSWVQDLSRRREDREQARQKAEQASRMVEQSLRPRLQEIEREYEATFSRLGLEPGDEGTLSLWLRQQPDYLQLSRDLQKALGSLEEHKRELEGEDPLSEYTEAELEAGIREKESLAGKHEELVQSIVEIEEEIRQAKAGREVERVLSSTREAEEKLADACEQDRRAAVGSLLTEHVRQAAAQRSRPGVFRSADALLTRITRGRLCLDLQESGDAAFVAFDQLSRRVKSVQELSTGERVQLLLAVRLGFAEQEEQLARLPILLDETLGNADDERAAAIIDALLQLSRDGRQIFYFSAQEEEIGKWLTRLQGEDMEYRFLDLQQIRQGQESQSFPLRPETWQKRQTPSPEGLSHAEYGRVLDVPGLDPLLQSPQQTHLWHVVDDAGELYTLLRHGVSRVGEVQNLLRHGGEDILPGRDWTQRFLARCKALEAAFEAWSVGRGHPVDRQALEESSAVSTRFLDQVSELASSLSGDAKELLAALQRGEIPRWQSSKTEELRQYLEEQGYLDLREPYSTRGIYLYALARVSAEVEQGLVDTEWLERLVSRFTREERAFPNGVLPGERS